MGEVNGGRGVSKRGIFCGGIGPSKVVEGLIIIGIVFGKAAHVFDARKSRSGTSEDKTEDQAEDKTEDKTEDPQKEHCESLS